MVAAQSSPRIPNPESRIPIIHLQSPLEGVIPEVTSSFGERRLTHFHSGYDFSTNKENGWRVVAPADGEIYRMKVERRGYGRALYIRHAGGFSTTYGHLFAFEDELLGLERRVKSAQASGGRFPGDIYPDPPIKVKAGQLVALAGEAGVGLPHLHFELRLNEEPVDPAVYSDLVVDGTGRVEIPALWINTSLCNVVGGEGITHMPKLIEIPLQPNEKGIWSNSSVPILSTYGSVNYCLSIEARDVGKRPRAVNEIDVSVDGIPYYKYENHHFDFSNYFESGWIFNPDASDGGRFVYNLYPPSGMSWNMLFKGVEFWKYKLIDSNGDHLIRVVARALGGSAVAEIKIKIDNELTLGHSAQGGTPKKVATDLDMYFRSDMGSNESMGLYGGGYSIPVYDKASMQLNGWNITFPDKGLPGCGLAYFNTNSIDDNPPLKKVTIKGIEFFPSDFYTREPMILSVKSPDTSHTDIYYWDENKKLWGAMNAVKGAGVLTSKLRGLGKFALFEDHVAPVVSALQSREEPKLALRRWYWPATDIGEGIDVEGCRTTVNRKAAGAPEVEYDPDREWVQFYRPLDWQPPKGLSVSCTDRAGNSSSGVKSRRRGRNRPRGRKRHG